MNGARDIDFARAQHVVGSHAIVREAETVPVADAVGRILAEDVRAAADHPPFANSAMDGWAVSAAGTPGRLRVVGEAAAGHPYAHMLAPGCAIRISTGAPVPPGADAVVPREDGVEDDGVLVVDDRLEPGRFVRGQGDDVRAGEVVLRRGARIAPHHLAVAAGAGQAILSCVQRPRVALLVTGTELVAAGEMLGDGRVWDIAGAAMPALIAAAGGELVRADVVDDDPQMTHDALAAALADADLVVTTGGISVGDHDHLRPIFARLGVGEVFRGVRIRPGHPTWFGRRDDVRVLALPGNPVAGVVCFWMFGRPLLGCRDHWLTLPLAVDYLTPTPRTDLIRCAVRADGLVPCARQASHHVTSLSDATHIAVVPERSFGLRKGAHLAAVSLAG